MFKKIGLAIAGLVFGGAAFSQVNYSEYIESGEPSSYNKIAVKERQVVAYPPLREGDVKYYKRIIRCIDARQKINKPIEWPQSALYKIMYDNLLNGELKAFTTDSLLETSFYTPEDMVDRGSYTEIIQVPTEFEGEFRDSAIPVRFEADKIKKYWLLEDWIFDYKYSVFKPRILAIAPIFQPTLEGLPLPEEPLAWAQMDMKMRELLSKHELFNTYNDAARLSYDDFFQMRMFDSYIIRESNVFNQPIRRLEEFKNDNIGALLESDRVKNDLFIFEHDLWQY